RTVARSIDPCYSSSRRLARLQSVRLHSPDAPVSLRLPDKPQIRRNAGSRAMESPSEIRQRYEQALESLVEKVEQDPTILAAILMGSLSYDVVWEKSDIDLVLIRQEGKQKNEGCNLVEDGINVHAVLTTRSEFKKMMEGSLQSSF